MNKNLFRKKSIDKISSPERIDEYIKVSSPGVWIILVAVAVLLIGVCVWGVFGKLDTKLDVVGVNQGGSVICYLKEDKIDSVKKDMKIEIDGNVYGIVEISEEPIAVDESFKDYTRHVGGLSEGEWVYIIRTDCALGSEGAVFNSAIIIEEVAPFHFVMN